MFFPPKVKPKLGLQVRSCPVHK